MFVSSSAIKFFLPVIIVIIPNVLVTNLITELYEPRLVVNASQTMLAGMKFSMTGTPNSHEYQQYYSSMKKQLCLLLQSGKYSARKKIEVSWTKIARNLLNILLFPFLSNIELYKRSLTQNMLKLLLMLLHRLYQLTATYRWLITRAGRSPTFQDPTPPNGLAGTWVPISLMEQVLSFITNHCLSRSVQ